LEDIEMMTLAGLKPTGKELVRDVAQKMGISIVGWGDNDRHRNSQWCFGTAAGPNLGFAWWKRMKTDSNGNIYFLNDAGDWAIKCRRKGKTQAATKAESFDNLINACYYQQKPLRVAIVDGRTDPDDDDAHEKADKRELDTVPWYPHHKDPETGFIVVMRGVPQPADFDPNEEYVASAFPTTKNPDPAQPSVNTASPVEPPAPPELPKPPQQATITTTAYSRDSDVVRRVKERVANGRCECCGKQGFLTARGGYYLEVHHVIPLECEGPDEEWNALAICPDEHKQAHYGADRKELRDKMILILGGRFPERLDYLMGQAAKMDRNVQSAEEIEGLVVT
jgi:5-methylcytosine-specific restriction protein A